MDSREGYRPQGIDYDTLIKIIWDNTLSVFITEHFIEAKQIIRDRINRSFFEFVDVKCPKFE